MMRITLVVAAALAMMLPSSIFAQVDPGFARPPVSRAGEITFYSRDDLRGETYTVTGPRTNVRIPFRARSFRVALGEAWSVCLNTQYRDPCVTVDESNEDRGLMMLLAIRSLRPVRSSGGGGWDGEFSGTGPTGPTLAGMASQFFRAPLDRGNRVLACRAGTGSASCFAETADRYCRARGYAGGAAYERGETVSGRTYLADVLCSRAAS